MRPQTQTEYVRVGGIFVPVNRRRNTCFAGGTLVHTVDGPKAIATLRPDDRVICSVGLDEVVGEVVEVLVNESEEGFSAVRIPTGAEDIVSTRDHVFALRDGEYAFAADLSVGSHVRARRPVDIGPATRVEPLYRIYNIVTSLPDAIACFAVGSVGLAACDRL